MCVVLSARLQTLGYWSMRGLAQAVRYVLAYSGVPFADVRYQQGGAPEFSRAAWLEVKEQLQLAFPNLPYYIEPATHSQPEIKLTQSTTILRHLGRKYHLIGGNLKEQALCDLILDTAYDFKVSRRRAPGTATGQQQQQRQRADEAIYPLSIPGSRSSVTFLSCSRSLSSSTRLIRASVRRRSHTSPRRRFRISSPSSSTSSRRPPLPGVPVRRSPSATSSSSR